MRAPVAVAALVVLSSNAAAEQLSGQQDANRFLSNTYYKLVCNAAMRGALDVEGSPSIKAELIDPTHVRSTSPNGPDGKRMVTDVWCDFSDGLAIRHRFQLR